MACRIYKLDLQEKNLIYKNLIHTYFVMIVVSFNFSAQMAGFIAWAFGTLQLDWLTLVSSGKEHKLPFCLNNWGDMAWLMDSNAALTELTLFVS